MKFFHTGACGTNVIVLIDRILDENIQPKTCFRCWHICHKRTILAQKTNLLDPPILPACIVGSDVLEIVPLMDNLGLHVIQPCAFKHFHRREQRRRPSVERMQVYIWQTAEIVEAPHPFRVRSRRMSANSAPGEPKLAARPEVHTGPI